MIVSKFPTYNIVFKNENPRTNLDLQLQSRKHRDDFSISINLEYDLYLKEFDKKISVISNILANYQDDDVKKLDIIVNYKPIDEPTPDDFPIEFVIESDSEIDDEPLTSLAEPEQEFIILDDEPDLSLETNVISNNLSNFMDKFKEKFVYEDEESSKEDIEKPKISSELAEYLEYIKQNHEMPSLSPEFSGELPPYPPERISSYSSFNEIGEGSQASSHTDSIKKRIVIKTDNYKPNKLHKKLKLENKLIDLLDNKPYIKIEPDLGGDNTLKDNLETKLYYHLKLLTYTDPFSITKNIIYIITELMKFVNNFDIPGVDKKNNIITALKQFLEEQGIDSNEIKYIIDVICPELIDILVSIDKRKIIIKKKLFGCLPIC